MWLKRNEKQMGKKTEFRSKSTFVTAECQLLTTFVL
jgi:hypothetical protein